MTWRLGTGWIVIKSPVGYDIIGYPNNPPRTMGWHQRQWDITAFRQGYMRKCSLRWSIWMDFKVASSISILSYPSYPFLNRPRDQSSYQVRGTYLSNVLRVQSSKGLSRDRQGMSVEKVHPQVPQHVQTWRRIDHTCAKMKVTLACPISLVAGLDRDKPYGTNLVPKQRRYTQLLSWPVASCWLFEGILIVLSEIMALSA